MNQRKILPFVAALVAAAALGSGAAWAAADPLDEANENVTKAVQALKGMEQSANAAGKDPHRSKAITLLMRAQGEILKAKKAASEQ